MLVGRVMGRGERAGKDHCCRWLTSSAESSPRTAASSVPLLGGLTNDQVFLPGAIMRCAAVPISNACSWRRVSACEHVCRRPGRQAREPSDMAPARPSHGQTVLWRRYIGRGGFSIREIVFSEVAAHGHYLKWACPDSVSWDTPV